MLPWGVDGAVLGARVQECVCVGALRVSVQGNGLGGVCTLLSAIPLPVPCWGGISLGAPQIWVGAVKGCPVSTGALGATCVSPRSGVAVLGDPMSSPTPSCEVGRWCLSPSAQPWPHPKSLLGAEVSALQTPSPKHRDTRGGSDGTGVGVLLCS